MRVEADRKVKISIKLNNYSTNELFTIIINEIIK